MKGGLEPTLVPQDPEMSRDLAKWMLDRFQNGVDQVHGLHNVHGGGDSQHGADYHFQQEHEKKWPTESQQETLAEPSDRQVIFSKCCEVAV